LTGIEGFKNLTYLSAVSHEIKHIDLSSNTKLDSLYLNGNNLSVIDFEKNTALIEVQIMSNAIHTINGLQYAKKLKNLYASYNDLSNFSLENNAIEQFYVSDNLLEKLDITKAPNLTNLYAISNKINKLDLSRNQKLETLDVSGNKISEIELQNNIALTYARMRSNQLSELDVSNNPKLIDLRVTSNPNLRCMQIGTNQSIPNLFLSEDQNTNASCN
jgi:protein phosphatase 1 regulatory subunit 7